MKTLQHIAQWIVSVPMIILGVAIAAELGVQYSVPFILAGLIVNPIITKMIHIGHKKLILIASSLVLCVVGLVIFPSSITYDPSQYTATSADVAASVAEEVASSVVEEAPASSIKEEPAASSQKPVVASSTVEKPASSNQENSKDTVKEYMQLIDRAYKANSFDSIDKADKKTFKAIKKSDTEIANFTKAWKQYFKNHMTNAQTNGKIDDMDNMKFLDKMISLYENFLPDEANRISEATNLQSKFEKDDANYRSKFNAFFRGYKTPGTDYEVPEVHQMTVNVYYKMDTTYADAAAELQDKFNHDKHDLYYAQYYADEKGGYWVEVEIETDDSFFFPQQGSYDIMYVVSSKKATIVDSYGFKSEIERFQLLGDDSDYGDYNTVCYLAEQMKEYPSDVWSMAMNF